MILGGFRAEKPPNRLDLSIASEQNLTMAPLATPETLSECSSIDSESWKGKYISDMHGCLEFCHN